MINVFCVLFKTALPPKGVFLTYDSTWPRPIWLPSLPSHPLLEVPPRSRGWGRQRWDGRSVGKSRVKSSPGHEICVPHPFLPLCGFGLMLGCKIKGKEIKRLPLAGKANSASLLLEPWGGGVRVLDGGVGGGSHGVTFTSRALPFLLRATPPWKAETWATLTMCALGH